MEKAHERNWTAQIVISSEHAGLKPYFKAFEDEMYRVLARCDDPHEVLRYLDALKCASFEYGVCLEALRPHKRSV